MTRGYASPLPSIDPPPPVFGWSSDEDDEPVVALVPILNVDLDLFNNGGGCLRTLLPPSVSPVTTAPTSPIADLIAPIPSPTYFNIHIDYYKINLGCIFYYLLFPSLDDAVVFLPAAIDTPVTISLPVAWPIAVKSFSETQSNMLNNVFVRRSKSPKL